MSLKNRKDRFISAYIEAKFPEAYNEAIKTYEKVDAVYTNKRDLTKTVEFVYLTTGVTSLTQYYQKKKAERVKKQLEKEAPIKDNMILEIPLFGTKDCIQQQQQQQQETNEAALIIPDEVYQNLLEELRKDPDLYSILNDMDMPCDDSIDSAGEQPGESNLDAQCVDIFSELNQDPVLQAILSDQQTPLERELSLLNY